ncbi:hypothetical protein APHAL10511_008284 [Amanita phalloides]|nr:hypothetical protein APHAL10511_008284 [Amanita phalloides]
MQAFSLLASIFLLAAVERAALAFPNPEYTSGNTTVHDPTMCKDNAGKYWLFSSDVGIEIRTSTDRAMWTYLGTVWPNGAKWTNQYSGKPDGSLWAPACKYVNEKFILYYASSTSGSRNSAIFLATSETGQPGEWNNEGLIISTSDADDYNAIDPNLLIDDDGKWWLSFGSYWSGIKVIQLNNSTGHWLDTEMYTVATRTEDNGAMEGSNIYKYDNYYYLFTSWDRACCNIKSTYNIRVGRSPSVTGPYVDQAGTPLLSGGGTLVLGPHDNIYGPGGQDQLTDTDGVMLIYHYWNSSKGLFLGMNHLDFSSGWPVAIYGPVNKNNNTSHTSGCRTCRGRHSWYTASFFSQMRFIGLGGQQLEHLSTKAFV